MHGITLLLIAAIGVDVGWKPTENGELEYIIQIAPEQLQALKTGDVIEVGVRPMLRSVRRYRIVVGTDPLPRQSARPTTENQELEAEVSQSAPVLSGGVNQSQPDSAQLQLPDPPVPQLPLEEKTTSHDHSVMVKPDDTQKAPDPRWVAATDEYPAIQLQPIPTRPIPSSTAAATVTEGTLDALPPPPEATVGPTLTPGNVETSAARGAGDPFTPDYRKRGSDDEGTGNREGYHLGDSVPIDQRAMQTSGTVPPTPRLMLPPPPDTENSSATSQPPSQEQGMQEEKISLPPPPQIEQDSNIEQPSVIKTAAAPRDKALGHHDKDALHEPHAPSEAVTDLTPPITVSERSSGGVWLTLALFASLGGNLFLGYVAWDIRKRFLTAFGRESSNNRKVESKDTSTSPGGADPLSESHP